MMCYFVIDDEGEVHREVVDRFRAYTSHVGKRFEKDFGSRLDSGVVNFLRKQYRWSCIFRIMKVDWTFKFYTWSPNDLSLFEVHKEILGYDSILQPKSEKFLQYIRISNLRVYAFEPVDSKDKALYGEATMDSIW